MFFSALRYLRRYLGLIMGSICSLLLALAMLAPYTAPSSAISIIIAILGLAFPYFFLAELFVIFWSWWNKLRYMLYLSAALSIFALLKMGGYVQFRLGAATGEKFRILTYNVHYFDYLHRQNGLAKDKNMFSILKDIGETKADIVCLQEFSASTSAFSEQAHLYMLSDLGYKYYYKGGRSSLAIYARFPLSNGRTINFEGSYNGAICADALIDGRAVRLYNLHLQSIKLGADAEHIIESSDLKRREAAATKQKYSRVGGKLRQAFRLRQQQAEELAADFKQCPLPLLVTGDLNDTPISYTYHCLNRYLYDSFREAGTGFGSTYAGAIPWLRIDYVFADPKFKVNWHSVRQQARAADHYPVLVGFSWKK